MEYLEGAQKILEELVAQDSSSTESCDHVCGVVERILAHHSIPLKKKLFQVNGINRAALVARIGPEKEGGIVLSGHLDVVPALDQKWRTPPFVLINQDDRFVGRGTCDMKGFISCALSLIPFWKEQKIERPIYIVLSTDEETNETPNSISKAIEILSLEPRPSVVIVGEPTNMDIIIAHKGVHRIEVDITGKSAHSCDPDQGINAIEIAQEIIQYVQDLAQNLKEAPRDESMTPPYITVNIATISGGSALNIVPEKCSLGWSFRPIKNQQALGIEKDFRDFIQMKVLSRWCGATISIAAKTFPAMEKKEDNAAVRLAQSLLPASKITTAPFGTEAGFFQQIGIDTIVCGPGSINQAHKPDEFILKSEMKACLSFLQQLV